MFELALGQRRLVAQALELLRPRAGAGSRGLLLRGDGVLIRGKCDCGERRKKGCNDLGIDGIGRKVLADRPVVLRAEVITEVGRPGFVLYDPLMSARPTLDQPV